MLGAISRRADRDGFEATQHRRVAIRDALRTAEQVTLQVVHSQLEKQGVLFAIFDSFGNDAAARDPTHIDHGAQNLAAHRILLDTDDKVAIDLHIVWPDRGPGLQSGRSGAQVIDGDVAPQRAQWGDRRGEQYLVFREAMLGYFEHDVVGIDLVRGELLT